MMNVTVAGLIHSLAWMPPSINTIGLATSATIISSVGEHDNVNDEDDLNMIQYGQRQASVPHLSHLELGVSSTLQN